MTGYEAVIEQFRKRTEERIRDGYIDHVGMQNVILLAILDELRAQR